VSTEPSVHDRVPPHIVDAARHVLAQDGLAAATLERISAAAGISRMTLHRRGVTKEDILRTLAEQLQAAYREAYWPALVSKGTGRERLELALTLQCRVTEENLATLQALSESAGAAIYHERGANALTRQADRAPADRWGRRRFAQADRHRGDGDAPVQRRRTHLSASADWTRLVA
jgi:AcrR family transcriptional regulator